MINLTRLQPARRPLMTPMLTATSLKGHTNGPYQVTLNNFPRAKKPYSTCKFFFGRRGTAKSLSMVFMMWCLSNAYDKYMGPAKWCNTCHMEHRPVRIATNFQCDFP